MRYSACRGLFWVEQLKVERKLISSAMIWVKTSLARWGAQTCRVIQGADHILDDFLAVGIAGAFLGDFAPTMHDDDTIGNSEDIRQRMTNENRGHALAA